MHAEKLIFLDLLKDTVDKDVENRNGDDSEIILEYPTFRNTKIYNKKHLDKIIEYYYIKTGDEKIYDVTFDEIFSYTSHTIDLNFTSLDIMRILFEDANEYVLKRINDKIEIFEEMDELPFDEYYMKKVKKGMLGQSFNVETNIIDIKVSVKYLAQFESKISFKYNIISKKVFDYEIQEIILEN